MYFNYCTFTLFITLKSKSQQKIADWLTGELNNEKVVEKPALQNRKNVQKNTELLGSGVQ